MTTHSPQFSAACALLMLRQTNGLTFRNLAKELAAMQTNLTGYTPDVDEIREELRTLSQHLAYLGFVIHATDAPDLTTDAGRVLSGVPS